MNKIALVGLPILLAACAPRLQQPLARLTENGQIVATRADAVVEEARLAGERERAALERAGPSVAEPVPSCTATACDPAQQADFLLRQGDAYTAAGELELALQRYDQADILRPGHAETTLRIARVLDKQLRPIEAVLRYRLFIHQLELERIGAQGEAAARIAEAIARAHERIVVLERR